ncbi:MAG TPA: trehalose-6-phosphate synthase [Gaiellaceae bacterium]|nr:trehalose-6-phosphate synthase [Gaiellaceae bacterium]
MELPLVALANRLPVSRTRAGWRPSAGGLVTALKPVLERRGGTWVGWDGGAEDVPRRVEGLDVELHPISLGRRQADDYYHGFANRTLWPLLHGLVEQPVFDRSWWRAYRSVNERFAEGDEPEKEQFRWVHDYHLMLLPALLREGGSRGPISFFLHIPFPAPEIFARLPWRAQLLDGLLGADAVSFHTREYRDNFLRTCARLRPDVRVHGTAIESADGRETRALAHPISIDAQDFAERAVAPGVERCLHGLRTQFARRRVLLGVDRLDYTKGIIERLRAIELLLEQRPALARELAFVQIAVPSRGEVREYRTLRASVEELVGRINGRFTEPGRDVPVHYLYRGVTPDRLLAYYRLADVCLVTPLQDGMNLVAKEFVTAQAAAGCDGVLLLSEFTGAAAELHGAVPCNPYDVDGLVGAIELALELEPDERQSRLQRMARQVATHDVFWWVDQELRAGTAAGAPAGAPS